jgi:hypothetical protein
VPASDSSVRLAVRRVVMQIDGVTDVGLTWVITPWAITQGDLAERGDRRIGLSARAQLARDARWALLR